MKWNALSAAEKGKYAVEPKPRAPKPAAASKTPARKPRKLTGYNIFVREEYTKQPTGATNAEKFKALSAAYKALPEAKRKDFEARAAVPSPKGA